MIVHNKDGSTDIICDSWAECGEEATEYMLSFIDEKGGNGEA